LKKRNAILTDVKTRKIMDLYYPKKVGNRLTNLLCLILVVIVWAHVIYAGRVINERIVESSKFKSSVHVEEGTPEEGSFL